MAPFLLTSLLMKKHGVHTDGMPDNDMFSQESRQSRTVKASGAGRIMVARLFLELCSGVCWSPIADHRSPLSGTDDNLPPEPWALQALKRKTKTIESPNCIAQLELQLGGVGGFFL